MKKKRILIVSLGSIGQRHLRNARDLMIGAEIGVLRLHTRGDAAVPPGADRMFARLEDALAFKPDAVIIASPASEHVKNATDFLSNGANLFIEKPLAVTSAEAGKLIEASRSSSRFTMVGYVLRFQPMVKFLKDTIASGMVGEVRTARVEVGQYLPDWRPDSDYRKGVSAQKALGGGALLELSHEIDYSAWIFGKPDRLFCSAGRLSDLEIDVEDSATLVMEYGPGETTKRVTVQLDFLQRTANMAVQVVGSKGTLYADLIREEARALIPGSPTKELAVPKLKQGNEMYLRQFDFFFAKSFTDYEPRFPESRSYDGWSSVDQAAYVLKLVDLARESNEKGIRVSC